MSDKGISRRDFFKRTAQFGLILGGASFALSHPDLAKPFASYKTKSFLDSIVEEAILQNAPLARYWVSTSAKNAGCANCHTPQEIKFSTQHNHSEETIRCLLCAQRCFIKSGERGKCRARMNIDGELRSLVYGHPVAIHTDPIEKKPFYHFLPAIEYTSPDAIVESAVLQNTPVIAFTYNEPTVFTEYLLDIAEYAKGKKVRSVLVSCGFMNEAPLTDMCNALSAIKIDLKGYSEDFYRNVCNAELKPVLNSIKQISRSKVHLEIVNLVVPTLNDSEKMLNNLTDWIAGEIGPDVPIHFTRFHPDYKLANLSSTPVSTLEYARDTAMKKGIHFVYIGNVPGHPGNNTYCPFCGKEIIKRSNFFVLEMKMTGGRCDYCNHLIAGVWQ
ncbi:MAG: AmmeMemoRadiSam system radical SAM enzyme [Ignavibacteriaceae bacterium]